MKRLKFKHYALLSTVILWALAVIIHLLNTRFGDNRYLRVFAGYVLLAAICASFIYAGAAFIQFVRRVGTGRNKEGTELEVYVSIGGKLKTERINPAENSNNLVILNGDGQKFIPPAELPSNGRMVSVVLLATGNYSETMLTYFLTHNAGLVKNGSLSFIKTS